MRKALLTSGLLVLLPLLVPTGAAAQNYDPREALSASRLGTTTCVRFTGMSPRERDALVRRIGIAAPQRSLTTPLPEDMAGDAAIATGIITRDSTTVPGTPLTAGQLIAACQSAPAGATLRQAFSNDQRLTTESR